jgi:hypothetical protein
MKSAAGSSKRRSGTGAAGETRSIGRPTVLPRRCHGQHEDWETVPPAAPVVLSAADPKEARLLRTIRAAVRHEDWPYCGHGQYVASPNITFEREDLLGPRIEWFWDRIHW